MQGFRSCTHETLQIIHDALVPKNTGERRREPRHTASAKCEVRIFNELGDGKSTVKGELKNISFRGMSVVAELPAPIPVGRPIEVLVQIPGFTRKYVAGVVAHCRKLEHAKTWALGMNVKAAGAAPILTGDLKTVKATYEWFNAGLKAPE